MDILEIPQQQRFRGPWKGYQFYEDNEEDAFLQCSYITNKRIVQAMLVCMVLIDVLVVNVAQSYNCWEASTFSAMDSYTSSIQICAICTSPVAIACTIYPQAAYIANITMGFLCQFFGGLPCTTARFHCFSSLPWTPTKEHASSQNNVMLLPWGVQLRGPRTPTPPPPPQRVLWPTVSCQRCRPSLHGHQRRPKENFVHFAHYP